MTEYRRNFIAGGSFFFTVNLAERRLSLLTSHIDELLNAIRETRKCHPFIIDAIVVLPDHLHAVWTLPEGDADFATGWRLSRAAKMGLAKGCRPMGFAPLSPSYDSGRLRPQADRLRSNAGFGAGSMIYPS